MADTHAADPQEPLSLFTPPTRAWFAERFGTPTPPQARGWAAIQRGEHVLLLAPTGSGKTLAAFLWGIDQRYRELAGLDTAGELQLTPPDKPRAAPAILYISPLKALNNDISRNLQVPLEGLRETAGAMGRPFPEIRVAVRSGDTPAKERQAMVRRPPDILITTPESLYLMLTSPTARRMFRSVRTVILDEIHTLVGSKRGTHLSLTLERLAEVAGHPVQRIGLSATIQPLEEAARFLGGSEWQEGEEGAHLQPRPVTIVDAAYRKPLDLKVVSPAEQFRQLPGGSIWPSLTPRV
ncbi:MAG TPA: DEAD/DEAH box helicase, partial [Armatimonadota bacterium]|nr:DEAD/DEAH box helicase [Armatimonadota bacterium]